MKKVQLVDQKRTGLFAEHSDGIAAPAYVVRATIPAVEALVAAGNSVWKIEGTPSDYTVVLGGTVPTGIVGVHLNDEPYEAIRLENEPTYPIEFENFWLQVGFTPCPVCSAAVVWYEAGYVPGYRVCCKAPHHHSLPK